MPKHMRLFVLLLGLGLLAAGCSFTSNLIGLGGDERSDSGLKKKVVVAPFVIAKPDLAAQADLLVQRLAFHLKEDSAEYEFVDYQALSSRAAALEGAVANPEERHLLAAKAMGVNLILAGHLVDLSIQYQLTGIYGMRDNTPFLSMEVEIRLIDVNSSTIAGRQTFVSMEKVDDVFADGMIKGNDPDPKMVDNRREELLEDCLDWARSHLAMLPWSAIVVDVDGDNVRINAGKGHGLTEGRVLAIQKVGESIRTGSGQTLYLPGPRLCRMQISEVGEQLSWGKLVAEEDQEELPEVKLGAMVRSN